MNALAQKAREGFLGADIAWDTDVIKLVALTSTYVFNAAHAFLSSVPAGARVATSVAFTAKTILDGTADAADVTLVAVPSGSTITQLWVFQDTGVESTSRLIAYYDTKADTTGISVVSNGGDILIQWAAAGLFKL